MSDIPCKLTTSHRSRGRALFAQPDGTLYRSVHLNIDRSTDDGASWQRILTIPRPFKRAMVEPFRMLCRLFRHEVRTMLPLADGSYVVSTRQGMYFAESGQRAMIRARVADGGQPASYPMCVNQMPDGRIVWGEYSGVKSVGRRRLFYSDDAGRSYRVAHEFALDEISHVHNVFYDATLDRLWVFTGDHGPHAGMALLTPDFKAIEWVGRGEQKYRAVMAFDLGESLVYGTDTEVEDNYIYRLDKRTRRIDRLAETDGSCIHACRCGPWFVLSTTAERTKTSAGRVASLWVSSDAQHWHRVLSCRKDCWSYKYFQFGSLVLPRGDSGKNVLMYSGQALRGIDGRLFTARLDADGTA